MLIYVVFFTQSMEISEDQTNIFDLPPECLFKIMNLAGCCLESNSDIRLVCKYFYEVYSAFTSCGVKFDSVTVSSKSLHLHSVND